MFHVKFPGLGLVLEINRVALEFLGIRIYWYGIIISFGFMLALYLALKNCNQFEIPQNLLLDLVIVATPISIISARLYYVVFRWEEFGFDILKIINIRTGGLAIYGGILGAVATTVIFAKVKKIKVFKLLDFGLPYFMLAQAIGRWGNFFNQEAFGTNTSLPWGMKSQETELYLSQLNLLGASYVPSMPVHPTFLYESIWNLMGFMFLLWYANKKKFVGEICILYFVIYGAGRFCIEGLRTDSLMIGNLRVSQMVSLLAIMIGIILYYVKGNRKKKGV